MADQALKILFFGNEPYSAKLAQALFLRKGVKLSVFVEPDLPEAGAMEAADLILVCSTGQMESKHSEKQVLVSEWPVKERDLKFWSKSPLNEERVDNILFYGPRSENFLNEFDGSMSSVSLNKVRSFIGNDADDLKEVVAEFIDGVSTNLRLLYEAIRDLRPDLVSDIAHKMKSSVAYYDVGEISGLLDLLEKKADAFSPAEMDDLFAQANVQLTKLRASLINMLY